MGIDNTDDRWISRCALGDCRTCIARCFRSGNLKGGFILIRSERGSAVVSALLGITITTLVSLSVLGMILASWSAVVMRDAAISGARYGALADQTPSEGERYTLKLLRERVPLLASYETDSWISGSENGEQLNVAIETQLPGLAMMPMLPKQRLSADATLEYQFQ